MSSWEHRSPRVLMDCVLIHSVHVFGALASSGSSLICLFVGRRRHQMDERDCLLLRLLMPQVPENVQRLGVSRSPIGHDAKT